LTLLLLDQLVLIHLLLHERLLDQSLLLRQSSQLVLLGRHLDQLVQTRLLDQSRLLDQ
jgi:hypothetical protein